MEMSAWPIFNPTCGACSAAGASPEELLGVLQRRESFEPLPESLQAEVLRLVDEETEWAAAHNPVPDPVLPEIEDADSPEPVIATADSVLETEQDQRRCGR